MNKTLNLHLLRYMRTDFSNFRQRQFPCGNHPGRALLIPEVICGIIGAVCLGADMTVNLRTFLFCDHKNSRIGYDQGVRTDFFQFPEILTNPFQIFIMGNDICRNIYLYPVFMGKGYPCFHIFHCKVLCFRAETIHFPADVYCICSIKHRCL